MLRGPSAVHDVPANMIQRTFEAATEEQAKSENRKNHYWIISGTLETIPQQSRDTDPS